MTKQSINVGTSANDRKGDSLRAAFTKVNNNFDELYIALGLNDVTLNLGAFTFTGSVMSTDDSTNITIDKPITVNGEIVVDGDITPKTNLGASLGTPTRQFKSLYVSNNTIYIGGTAVGVDANGNLTTNGTALSSDRLSVTGSSVVLAKDQYDTTRLTFTGGATIETAGYITDVGGLALVDSSAQNYVATETSRVEIITGFPDGGTGVDSFNQWLFLKSGVLVLPKDGIIENNGKQWTFDTAGRTTFPNGTVPEHSYGAAGDKEGMVVFSDPYIYYCKQDYVDNVTDIWVRVAWTGTNW